MFTSVENASNLPMVQLQIEGETVSVPVGYTVAAALLAQGHRRTRQSPVDGGPRAPYCMMGVCYECLVEIDGQRNQQACMREVSQGMQIRLQCADEGEGAA
ncbi:(2Fe-2S)-binding protein [Marinobacterium arenosum]|uniref:(2Fe-2S)-binding protein n=1 Tax=Marinobacterium arenosum TaxID=2862496 RepID=UPI001C96DF07|nr:(2Fe-2S)-binding protein [Marinobacterium arenosum]MBY4676177.1 (2Fe-2S)-binding protein [Marinobacterium arenosum]